MSEDSNHERKEDEMTEETMDENSPAKTPRARLTQRDAHLIYVWLEDRREERMSLGEICQRLHMEGVVKFIPNTGSVSRIARDIGYEVKRGYGKDSSGVSDLRKQICLQVMRLDSQDREIEDLKARVSLVEKKWGTLSRIVEKMPGFSESFTRQPGYVGREGSAHE